ncbi:MAG: NAD(P)/FAD-dependent oxidoreductase, partial [Desulfuromonas sp.]|nr:NAD(P)/FAD-dependent oxidoreductase [Desulfuromonas sp.]
LSKKLLLGIPEASVWRGTETLDVTLHLGRSAVALDLRNREIRDDRGEAYRYERLLLATGGTPRRLPFGGDGIIYFRTLDDYRRLRAVADQGGSFAVIGGGFIGSEIAAALAANGRRVTMLFPESAICSRVFPADLADYVTGYYRTQGVTVLPGAMVADIRQHGAGMRVATADGQQLDVDAVVAGLGIELNVELARQAGLGIDNGIIVDELLRTEAAEVFAAGDIASFYNPLLDKRLRLEHEDNAVAMGKQAGRNMAGAGEPYHYLPFFYSDLFDLGYEAVGELDSRLDTVADWQEPFRKGVVYYLRDGKVRGVLLWNVWDQVENARKLLARNGPLDASQLKGLLPG